MTPHVVSIDLPHCPILLPSPLLLPRARPLASRRRAKSPRRSHTLCLMMAWTGYSDALIAVFVCFLKCTVKLRMCLYHCGVSFCHGCLFCHSFDYSFDYSLNMNRRFMEEILCIIHHHVQNCCCVPPCIYYGCLTNLKMKPFY